MTEAKDQEEVPTPIKKVHWHELLVGEGEDGRKPPINMEVPSWASPSAVNGRGLIATTKGKYVVVIKLKNMVMEAILDNRGGQNHRKS